ncbi:replication regulatory protein RepA [Buttiauxella sp. B2]|uniref:replication regulatory protein RepA n=1 Tax=Buttiauxella sp. B2 TaxID=2587812 RepID=UPI001121A55E|nr:replication regulatory protein RepA [Buttiauxella sp. B2]TNV10478.1 replication regulatory protein RepA [Buttiauxella sp. B2]
MSQAVHAETSSLKAKRPYRKGNPMTDSEKQLASVARKRLTHKELKVFVRNTLKDQMVEVCEEKGITQAQFIESLLEQELSLCKK